MVTKTSGLEKYFAEFRGDIVGNESMFASHGRSIMMIYSDWIASGRLYAPIEKAMQSLVGPHIANTHSFSSHSGGRMSRSKDLGCPRMSTQVVFTLIWNITPTMFYGIGWKP
ncbi:hypothetical protein [Flagellimonas baculiformis]|uniref:hypothetical protein n=1 Tax=Flagellimonas baculiformis TaxID=3067310 RepID=UPI00296EAE19|nr:hypothetical protein [Muricauda sp. D6]